MRWRVMRQTCARPDQDGAASPRVKRSFPDGVHGQTLWASNGTAVGTTVLTTADPGTEAPGSEFVPYAIGYAISGGALDFNHGLFVLYDQTLGQQLWVTDGTSGGTRLLADLEGAPGIKSFATQGLVVSSVNAQTEVFAVDDGVHGQQIWSSDGTGAGTRLLASVPSVAISTGPDHDPVLLGNGTQSGAFDNTRVFFSLEDGQELWSTDGTPVGTVMEAALVCYAAGTHILTAEGEQAIENLLQGDIVLTLSDGELIARPAKWLGHRRLDLTRHPRPETVAPIRIERDAFADNVPHRDLLVSPDHAIFVDGQLICARQLVNGTTIRRETGWSSLDYYHLELNEHAILLAEGLPSESYLDTGNRGFFANAGAPLVLHPDLTDETDHPTREAGSCAPFVWDEASVRPVWQRLSDRAVAIGHAASPRRVITTDADLRFIANRCTITPVFQ